MKTILNIDNTTKAIEQNICANTGHIVIYENQCFKDNLYYWKENYFLVKSLLSKEDVQEIRKRIWIRRKDIERKYPLDLRNVY